MEKVLILSLVLMGTTNSQAYTFKEENKPISSKALLEEAKKIGLTIPRDESLSKKEMGQWNQKMKNEHLDTGAPEPLLLEVEAKKANLEDAKTIARTETYNAVKKNWEKIKDSVLNENAVDSFEKFEPYLKRELNKLEYAANQSNKKSFSFLLPWADIQVDAKLKKVSWVIHIGSHLDGNRLEEGAERIIIPERGVE